MERPLKARRLFETGLLVPTWELGIVGAQYRRL